MCLKILLLLYLNCTYKYNVPIRSPPDSTQHALFIVSCRYLSTSLYSYMYDVDDNLSQSEANPYILGQAALFHLTSSSIEVSSKARKRVSYNTCMRYAGKVGGFQKRRISHAIRNGRTANITYMLRTENK